MACENDDAGNPKRVDSRNELASAATSGKPCRIAREHEEGRTEVVPWLARTTMQAIPNGSIRVTNSLQPPLRASRAADDCGWTLDPGFGTARSPCSFSCLLVPFRGHPFASCSTACAGRRLMQGYDETGSAGDYLRGRSSKPWHDFSPVPFRVFSCLFVAIPLQLQHGLRGAAVDARLLRDRVPLVITCEGVRASHGTSTKNRHSPE